MATALTTRTAEAVRAVIETWVELLVEKKYEQALAMLTTSRPLLDPLATETGWTPELLAKVIQNYGSVESRDDGQVFTVTSATAVCAGPRFDVTWFDKPVGCGWRASVGHAHYDLPLNGEWSDGTATIETEEGLALALDDVHVM
jgi:hypothetical protein